MKSGFIPDEPKPDEVIALSERGGLIPDSDPEMVVEGEGEAKAEPAGAA